MLPEFFIAPWRMSLSRAMNRNCKDAHHRFFQLATVTPEGKPSNRTVVFRGFLSESNQLKIITDRRSEKINHLQQQPWGEIAWYFTKTREQFRLAGTIEMITDQDKLSPWFGDRLKTWQELSDASRAQFSWPQPQQPRTSDLAAFTATAETLEQPSKNFVLLLFDPHRVDHLNLVGNPQNRWIYDRDEWENWSSREINP